MSPVPDPSLIACHIDESAGMDPAVNPTPAVQLHAAEDILDARRWFAYAYFERGMGWFKDAETAEALFDSVASGFTSERVREWAESMRRADDGSES